MSKESMANNIGLYWSYEAEVCGSQRARPKDKGTENVRCTWETQISGCARHKEHSKYQRRTEKNREEQRKFNILSYHKSLGASSPENRPAGNTAKYLLEYDVCKYERSITKPCTYIMRILMHAANLGHDRRVL